MHDKPVQMKTLQQAAANYIHHGHVMRISKKLYPGYDVYARSLLAHYLSYQKARIFVTNRRLREAIDSGQTKLQQTHRTLIKLGFINRIEVPEGDGRMETILNLDRILRAIFESVAHNKNPNEYQYLVSTYNCDPLGINSKSRPQK